jgi:signal peptidase II
LPVGHLGVFDFLSGEYLYTVVHMGRVVRTRLGRHLSGTGTPHWNIDFLRKAAEVGGYGYALAGETEGTSLECYWAQTLARLSEAIIPSSGFGSSDCHFRCRAHLVALPLGTDISAVLNNLAVPYFWFVESDKARRSNPSGSGAITTGLPEVKWGPDVCVWRRVLKKYVQDYAFLLGLAGIIILFDQWTKSLVRANLGISEIWAPWDWLLPYARIVHWQNTGAAFGMLQNFGGIFAVLAVLVAIAILYYFPQVPRLDWALRVAMFLQFGGAVGNLIDRIAYKGAVTDFVSLGRFRLQRS